MIDEGRNREIKWYMRTRITEIVKYTPKVLKFESQPKNGLHWAGDLMEALAIYMGKNGEGWKLKNQLAIYFENQPLLMKALIKGTMSGKLLAEISNTLNITIVIIMNKDSSNKK